MLFEYSCFIDNTSVLYGLFLTPLFAVLLFNTVIFVMVTFVLVRHTSKKLINEKKGKKVTQGTIKAIISIVSVMVMFGLSWLFGALSVSGGAVVFQWPFVILNTLQGFFIFLFSCVFGNDARNEWRNLLIQKRKSKHSALGHSQIASRAPRIHVSAAGSTNHNDLKAKCTYLGKSELSSSALAYHGNELQQPSQETTDEQVVSITDSAEGTTSESNLFIINNSVISEPLDKTDLSLKPHSSVPALRKVRRTRRSDSVLPPHVLFRLNFPFYDVFVEDSTPVELSQETDFTHEFETCDSDVFANLTGESGIALLDNDA